jgi:hypothetical protein
MTIVNFPGRPGSTMQGVAVQGWQTAEIQRLMNACAPYIPTGEAGGWDFGATECGDPQMYLLGPAPEHDCILSISRLGRLYILEDGQGRILFEQGNLVPLAEGAIVARLAIAWCAMREFLEEKVEPVMAEPLELLTHVAPQLAAFV